jgi:glucose/arabinose dehydrogenase
VPSLDWHVDERIKAMIVVAEDLNFPTSVTFGEDGTIYVAESGLPFDGAPRGGKVWRIDRSGERRCLLSDLRPPLNGLVHHEGGLIVSEGGYPGRISRLDLASGEVNPLIDNLPGFGNYQTNMVAIGPDDKLYFSQGAMTNGGIIGLDSHDLGWLRYVPHNCDIPGYDIVLSDVAAVTPDPRSKEAVMVETGAFAPFGTVHPGGHRIKGALPCTSAIMRSNADGSDLELVAWGLRNAYGLAFLPDGRLLATDQGADARGSRPLANCPDALFEVRPGAWYGWPDFVCGRPATSPEFKPHDAAGASFLLKNHASLPKPEHPVFEFEINSAAVKFAVVPVDDKIFGGQIIVALFGDERPLTGPAGPRVGRGLLRIDPTDWASYPVKVEGLKRPIDVRFGPEGSVFVVDFGDFEITPDKGLSARAGTGRLLRLKSNAFEA